MANENTIYEKLLSIQQDLKVPKNQENKFGGFFYRSCEDILEALKPELKKHKLVLTLSDKIINKGDRNYVRATAELRSGEEFIQTHAYAREAEVRKGMDDSQITGATSSYARKYALNGMFAIDDAKDADSDEHTKARQTAPQRDRAPKNQKAGEASAKQKKDIMALLGDLGATSNDDKKSALQEITGFNSVKNLTSKDASQAIEKLNQALDKEIAEEQ